MEEFEILKKLPRVAAPPDFERRIMTRLSEMKKVRTYAAPFRPRIWLAAVPAALIAAAVLVNVFMLRQPGVGSGPAGAERAGALPAGTGRSADVIRVMEPLDYRQDIRFLSEEPGTVYILESVSDEAQHGISY